MNWWKLITAGKKVLDVVVEHIPQALDDGKISMDEVSMLITKISNIFDYKIEVVIPEDVKDKVLEVTELLDTTNLEKIIK